MNYLRKSIAVASVLMLGAFAANTTVMAQNPTQVLDTVEVFCPTCALQMKFDDPERMEDDDFELLINQPGADFVACTREPANGFFCLDASDKTVKKWEDTANPAETVIYCEDPALDLDTRKANTCTGMTVGLGATWLAGKNKGKSFSLIKVFPEDAETGVCSGGSPLTMPTDTDLCGDELYTGRPLLVDIKAIQNESADDFPYGPGILGLEQRTNLSFFPEDGVADPVTIADKKAWGLAGNETLQSVDLLQINNPDSGLVDNYALGTSSNDRILAFRIGSSAKAFEVFNIADDPDLAARRIPENECSTDDQHYGLNVSEKSDVAYFTDQTYCLTVALRAEVDGEFDPVTNVFTGTGNLTGFVIAEEQTSAGTEKLILSTSGTAGSFAPVGPTTSPGIGFDLTDCFDACTLISGETGNAGAALQDVILASADSGVTLFQVKGLPHCSWIPETCYEQLSGMTTTDRIVAVDWLIGAGVLIKLDTLDPSRDAEKLVFNVVPLLPDEVTNLFDESGTAPSTLPDLWFPPEYRAQEMNGFIFEALFFVPQPDVQFDDVFTLEVDVSELTRTSAGPGPELGCELGLSDGTSANEMLLWDVTVRASERHQSMDGKHQGTIINAGCRNPTRGRSGGISIFPYNFELTPCPATLNSSTNYATDCGPLPDFQSESVDDAVFAKLYVTLYDELLAHLEQLACTTIDGGASAPLDSATCLGLAAKWASGKDKLIKALDATISPKTSSGSQNFGAVGSQLQNYISQLLLAPPNGANDPANRIGEQAARLETLVHVLNERLLPSIPANGFVEFDRTWADQ